MSKNKKKHNPRRWLEAQRAHEVVDTRSGTTVARSVAAASAPVKSDIVLPIASIKRDLVKNVIFMVASVLILIVLKLTNFGYAQISRLVAF